MIPIINDNLPIIPSGYLPYYIQSKSMPVFFFFCCHIMISALFPFFFVMVRNHHHKVSSIHSYFYANTTFFCFHFFGCLYRIIQRNNRNGQVIMTFILISLFALFIISFVSNLISNVSATAAL